MTDLRDDTRAGFAATFGYAPTALYSAPGRVKLIGEHTDYNQGFVLQSAIDRRTVLAVAPRQDRRIRVASSLVDEIVEVALADLDTARIDGWAAYPFGVARALGRFGADHASVVGADLYLDSNVPIDAGLGSSAAIETAVAVALNDLWQLDLDRMTLASVGRPTTAAGAPTDITDQTVSLLGQRDSAVFVDCRSGEAEVIGLGFEAAGLEILVMDTAVSRARASDYTEYRTSCERAAAELDVASLRELSIGDLSRARALIDDKTFRRLRHVITENQRVLDAVQALREGNPTALGELLDASHRSMRDDFEVSTPELNLAVETALANGAIGARMTGGLGGAAVALIPGASRSLLQVAIDGAFAEHGYGQPDTFVVGASSGAARE